MDQLIKKFPTAMKIFNTELAFCDTMNVFHSKCFKTDRLTRKSVTKKKNVSILHDETKLKIVNQDILNE